MNALKHTRLVTLAAIAFAGLAGSASATTCKDIESFGLANRPAIEKGLAQHYVSRAGVVLTGADSVRVQSFSGCRARVKVQSGLREAAGRNPEIGTVFKTHNGSMEMFVHFDAAQGDKMCVTKTDLQKVQFADKGPVQEKLFVRRHDDKNFFAGCTL